MQENLTPREQEILDLMLEGISTKEIAFKLSLSARTVDFHRNNINKKLNVGNYHELIAKYSSIKNRKDELISSADTQHKKPGKLYKFLIPAAVFILIGSIIPIWHFTEKASSLKPHEDMPVLNNTPVFKDHTYDTVYLKTSKIFVNTEKGYYGQSYYSYDEIFLRDFYSGTLDDLIPGGYEWYTVRISGTAETELKYVKINLMLKPYGNGDWILVGDSDPNYYHISPGNFSEEVKFCKLYNNLSEFPAGEVLFIISSGLYMVNSKYDALNFDTGIRIPDDVPSGTIVTTIRNFKIEPVLTPLK